MEATLTAALIAARARLAARQLLDSDAAVSARVPAAGALLLLRAGAQTAERIGIDPQGAMAGMPGSLHVAIYRQRADVGAIAEGVGHFGGALAAMGCGLPALFDEQVRHLGCVAPQGAGSSTAHLHSALEGGANAVFAGGRALCLGVNCQRMLLNAELFEKCAQAHALAYAAGGTVRCLPWWVRRIATGRLLRDERHAARRFAQGLLPEAARGY